MEAVLRSEMGVNKGSDKAKVEPSMKGKGERKSHRHQSPSPSLAVTGNDKNQDIFHCVVFFGNKSCEHDIGISKNGTQISTRMYGRHFHFDTMYYSPQSLAPSLEKNRLSTKLLLVAPPQIGKNPLLDIRGEVWSERVSFIQS